jgi:serine/threonine protein kinase
LSQFEILDVLGKGSFGEVFLVKKKGEEQLYAMKSLLKSKVKSQNLTKYVMTERDVLTLMNNPFIVQIHGAFQTKEKLYLVLEYCPGGDLEKKIIREKKISESIVKMYAAEIILAIEYLHKREIIFRDLKPANVVLDSEGHAKITDFGLAIQSK